MNTRTRTRRLTSLISGATLAIGAVTLGVFAPAAQAAPVAAAPAPTVVGAGCTVTDATLTWGVIERWRAYITGTIANGDWTLSDGTAYETPSFRWSNGTGEIADDGTGSIPFTGGILFSGHDDLLQINLANPVFELVSPTEGYLLLDLSSTKQTGEPDVALPGVRAVKIDLDGAIVANGETLEITGAPGVLTSEGASAFGGFYSAGEAVDPITLTATAPGCLLAAGATDPGESAITAEEPAAPPVVISEPTQIPWLPIGIGAVALLVIGVAAGFLLRKPAARGAADAAPTGSTPETPSDTDTQAQ